MIDLIVAYVNGEDPVWRKQYSQYFTDDRPQRFRDYGTLRYLLRGVEQNLPWINKVFLVVQQKSQLPTWLNVNNPKLRIVFHDEYIPNELLPTYNTNVIQNFYHRIPDLSNNFILANDDMVFIKPQDESKWFIGEHPQQFIKVMTEDYKPTKSGMFQTILLNNIRRFNEFCKTGKQIEYKNWHLPIPYSKKVWQETWNNHYAVLYSHLTNARRRASKNTSDWLFNHIQMYKGVVQHNPNCDTQGYFLLKDTTQPNELDELFQNNIVCLNDGITNNKDIFAQAISRLQNALPNASSFELGTI